MWCAMAVDLSRPLKAAIVDHLFADALLTSLVPADRIYAMSPPASPKWPFVRYGSPIASPYEATCWNGATVIVTLHAFAETKKATSTGPFYAGEDRALDIAAAIVKAMETFDPNGLDVIECEWTGTQCVKDNDEADQWHSWCQFSITVIQPQ